MNPLNLKPQNSQSWNLLEFFPEISHIKTENSRKCREKMLFLVRSREHCRRPVQTSHHEWHHFSVAPAFLHSSLPVSFAHSVCSLRTLTSSLAIWLWPNPKWALFSFNSSSLLSIIYSLNCEAQWDSSNLFLATWNCCAQITTPRKKPPEGPRLLISKV